MQGPMAPEAQPATSRAQSNFRFRCYRTPEKHWHVAAPTTAMSHIAIQEKLNGKNVDWMEQVSDEQYQG
jgi:hypothetical protein